MTGGTSSGAFVVRIPVTTGERMLVPEAMTLAIMKWRLAHLSPGNRWAPVLERYIEYSSARLDGVGGDASQVPASLTWKTAAGEDKGETAAATARAVREGGRGPVRLPRRVRGVRAGRLLRPPRRDARRGVADLVLRACRENLTVCVWTCGDSHRLEGISICA